MKQTLISTMLGVVALAGCGGGGGKDDAAVVDTNGVYQAYTTQGRQFPLAVDFTKLTYSYTFNGTVFSGTLNAAGTVFSMQPTGSTTYAGSFKLIDNAIVGSVPVTGGEHVTVIAAKTFVGSAADLGDRRFEVMSREVAQVGTQPAAPVRWGVYRVSAAASTLVGCEGTPTGYPAGAEPLSDPDSCPAGTTARTYALSATTGGVFKQTSPAGSTASPQDVRFAKVGDQVVMLSAPSGANDGAFTVGISGARGDLTGTYQGHSSLGASVSMTMGPAAGAVRFEGGTTGAPGSSNASGTLAAVASATNAMRYTASGASAATGGAIVSPALAVFGNFGANGDMTLFLR